MNFERHIDPKAALRIGIREKAYRAIEKIGQKYAFSLANNLIREQAKKEFEDEVGIPVEVFLDEDGQTINWNIQIPVKSIKLDLTISKNGDIEF